MAKTIPQLTEATTLTGAGWIPVDSGTESFKISLTNFAASLADVIPSAKVMTKWVSSRTYAADDVVYYGQYLYVSLVGSNTNNTPSQSSTVWKTLSRTGLNPQVLPALATRAVAGWAGRSAASATGWNTIIWVPTLKLFVAIAADATPAVMTSPDGVTWTSRTPSSANAWYALTYSPELGLLVAFAQDSGGNADAFRIMTSPDGITWTGRSPAAVALDFTDAAWADSIGLLVAVSATGTNRVETSPDGITWTGRTAAEANGWSSVAWSPKLALLAAVSFDGTNRVMTSPDGINWTARAAGAANQWRKVIWSEFHEMFVAVAVSGTNRVMYSRDGITWTAVASADETVAWTSLSVSPELGVFVATGGIGLSPTNKIMTSVDGITWTSRTITESANWLGIAWSGSKGIFAAVNGNGTNRVATSRHVKQFIAP